ncbi:MAG: hypothetical protein KBG20_04975 [Caldilineaceae bacterium]|nr:hypothetical protein [Caldilineaceae bacterium]MBP8107324.1 hypothetical protein [Caldilineaceae bacterium]MBP8121673.1 hypothetical protein [Caldilineaceae bacterium]MBP9071627.1 hypothetical protein [Caldilineaceae bacterium]
MTFVVATTLLVLAEVSTNVVNELDGQGIAIISAPQVQPTVTATPTLTPEELQEILRQSTISN